MRIFLMYYDRYKNATTSKLLPIEHTILCHDNADKFECIGDKGKIIQTNQPKGIQNNFNYALQQLNLNEWAIFMSDDLKYAKKLNNNRFETCSVDYVLNELINTIPLCDKIGVKLVGLNSTGNALYAKTKYSKYGLVDGRCFAIKKTDFTWHPQINTIPDYFATAYHLQKYGGNLILNYCYLEFERYSKGGLGSIDDRTNDKRKDCKLMLNLFPNHVKLKMKTNEPFGTHIILNK